MLDWIQLIVLQPVNHGEAGSRAQLSLKTQPNEVDVINEADVGVDSLRAY